MSADATPVILERLPGDLGTCITSTSVDDDDWLEWNLGRSRARSAATGGADAEPGLAPDCTGVVTTEYRR